MVKTIATILFMLTVMVNPAVAAGQENTMKIQFIHHGTTVIGSLENNAASREFWAMLPLTVKLEDYGSAEKIAWLPRKLRQADARQAITPVAGDIAYYVPWGNLAIFREGFRHSSGLVRLGRIEQGLESLRQSGVKEITITRSKNR